MHLAFFLPSLALHIVSSPARTSHYSCPGEHQFSFFISVWRSLPPSGKHPHAGLGASQHTYHPAVHESLPTGPTPHEGEVCVFFTTVY